MEKIITMSHEKWIRSKKKYSEHVTLISDDPEQKIYQLKANLFMILTHVRNNEYQSTYITTHEIKKMEHAIPPWEA